MSPAKQPQKPGLTEAEHKRPESINQILNHGLRLTGLPLTLSGLFRLLEGIEKKPHTTDNLLAGVAVVFMVSWVAAFVSVRPNQRGREALEWASGLLCYVGLAALVVLVCLMVFVG